MHFVLSTGAWQKSVDGNPQTELLSRPSGALYVKLSDVIGHEEDATILNDTNQKYHSVQVILPYDHIDVMYEYITNTVNQ